MSALSGLCQPLADLKFMKLLHTEHGSSVNVTKDIMIYGVFDIIVYMFSK